MQDPSPRPTPRPVPRLRRLSGVSGTTGPFLGATRPTAAGLSLAILLLVLGGCTGHPSEGAARGAATGAAGALVLGSPAVVAVPAGVAKGATANSLWEAWNRRKTQCAQLSRCVY